MEFVSVEQAREYIKANYPNDPLLKHIALNLLDQLPKVKIAGATVPVKAGAENG